MLQSFQYAVSKGNCSERQVIAEMAVTMVKTLSNLIHEEVALQLPALTLQKCWKRQNPLPRVSSLFVFTL